MTSLTLVGVIRKKKAAALKLNKSSLSEYYTFPPPKKIGTKVKPSNRNGSIQKKRYLQSRTQADDSRCHNSVLGSVKHTHNSVLGSVKHTHNSVLGSVKHTHNSVLGRVKHITSRRPRISNGSGNFINMAASRSAVISSHRTFCVDSGTRLPWVNNGYFCTPVDSPTRPLSIMVRFDSIYIYIYIYIYTYVTHTHTRTHTHIYIYIYMVCMCTCVFICLCVCLYVFKNIHLSTFFK